MMSTQRNLSIAKAIWRDFLALCERLICSAGMMPFRVIVGISIGGAMRAGRYALSALICATSVAAVGYFVAKVATELALRKSLWARLGVKAQTVLAKNSFARGVAQRLSTGI